MSNAQDDAGDFIAVATAAHANAVALRDAAKLLLAAGFEGSGTSLAIIGCEEAGKAALFLFGGIGALSHKSSAALWRAIHSGGQAHHKKQVMGKIAAVIGQLLENRLPEVIGELERIIQATPEPEGLTVSVADIRGALTPDLVGRMMRDQIQDMLGKAGEVAEGSWQRDRDAGLYVDWREGAIHSPTDLAPGTGSRYVEELERVLAGTSRFMWAVNLAPDQRELLKDLIPDHDELSAVLESNDPSIDPKGTP